MAVSGVGRGTRIGRWASVVSATLCWSLCLCWSPKYKQPSVSERQVLWRRAKGGTHNGQDHKYNSEREHGGERGGSQGIMTELHHPTHYAFQSKNYTSQLNDRANMQSGRNTASGTPLPPASSSPPISPQSPPPHSLHHSRPTSGYPISPSTSKPSGPITPKRSFSLNRLYSTNPHPSPSLCTKADWRLPRISTMA